MKRGGNAWAQSRGKDTRQPPTFGFVCIWASWKMSWLFVVWNGFDLSSWVSRRARPERDERYYHYSSRVQKVAKYRYPLLPLYYVVATPTQSQPCTTALREASPRRPAPPVPASSSRRPAEPSNNSNNNTRPWPHRQARRLPLPPRPSTTLRRRLSEVRVGGFLAWWPDLFGCIESVCLARDGMDSRTRSQHLNPPGMPPKTHTLSCGGRSAVPDLNWTWRAER